MPPRAVYCHRCGWKGRRRPGECACYDEWAMYCHCTWGRCPKCNQGVSTMSLPALKRSIADGQAYVAALATEN